MFVTVLFAAPRCAAQAMQKGISVELPATSNAVSMPDADSEDSLIVTVTHNGSLYFGINPIAPAALAEKVKGSLSNRTAQKLYIKADAGTPYADVEKVLDAARTAGVEAPTLLTAQRESEPRSLVPPRGLEVLVGSPWPTGVESTVVQVVNSGQQWPTLKINNEQIPWATLQSTLRQLLQNRREKVVLVKADGRLPFAHVVQVIDMCWATGAKVVLAVPGT
jgi:biopolymer transport protein ExbD/biopolymer transport protein TolR